MLTRLLIAGGLALTLLGADGILIRGASTFDTHTGTMRAGQTVWIEGERIRAVGSRVSAPQISASRRSPT